MQHPLDSKVSEFLSFLKGERRLSDKTVRLYALELKSLLRLLLMPEEIHGIRTYLGMKSSATARRKLLMWKNFLKTCEEPWKSSIDILKPPKLRQKLPRFLAKEEIVKLESACETTREKVFISLGLSLGLRLNELRTIRFTDIEDDFIRIHRKGDMDQRLPLNPDLQLLLRTWEKESRSLRKDPILNLSESGVRKILSKLSTRAGLERPLNPHALRHTFASTLAAKGASLVALKELMGHSKITTTERYLHVTPEHLRVTLEMLESKPKRGIVHDLKNE